LNVTAGRREKMTNKHFTVIFCFARFLIDELFSGDFSRCRFLKEESNKRRKRICEVLGLSPGF
jgi:hypothetical protein